MVNRILTGVMMLTKKELNKLAKLTTEEKALIAAELNAWKCPKPFKYLEPQMSKLSDKKYDPNNIRTLLRKEIEQQIGHKATNLGWWKYFNLDISTHDEWYKQNYG